LPLLDGVAAFYQHVPAPAWRRQIVETAISARFRDLGHKVSLTGYVIVESRIRRQHTGVTRA
jgi:hypothetical protein